ncbi:helix-turn-helix transcriptional regulator [Heyndrickxia sporothermodurans]|uniref:helix-turn-helix domain-containing protein n=1 Tax=Heyndrickxia sporothermodurans TaxID=46224 RepID=UPI002E1ED0C5|nr:helix-turn-helix transcriptional regulator [Heyndrickxia sporothermodurans]MED3697979.1 helix-turn-helix transcriptional regulator [Heyndrickxia sporothermodurans]
MSEVGVIVQCKLRDRRKAQGLSIRQLEAISGISRGRISDYENGKTDMSVETAARFTVVLNCTLDDLFEIKRM